MKKKVVFLVFVIVLLFTFAVPASAAPGKGNNGNQSAPISTSPTSYPLHQGVGPFEWKDYLQGTDFGINVKKGEDKFVPGFELGTEGTVLWHFVNPDKLGGYANITFLDSEDKEVIIENVLPYKNDQHFAVVTLQSWKLLSTVYFPKSVPSKGGTQFNLSHTAGKEQYGALKVTVDVAKEHDEITSQRYYEREVQSFYSRDVWDIYTRDVQDFYSRDVQKFYERDTYKRYVPVFEKKITIDETKTLTSLKGDNAGGKFNNGMVWLEIDVAKARSEGYKFGIAQSNPDNTYIDYDYNVKIEGDKLIISFDGRFIQTKITAKVYSAPPTQHDNSDHKTLSTGGTLEVNLPTEYSDKVYLYVHFEDGISWYTTGQYEFVGWRYKDTIIGDYYLVDTVTGKDKYIRTETGDYKFKDTKYGPYNFVDTVFYEYKLIKTEEITRKTVTDAYDVTFDLVVKNADDNLVYTGNIENKGEVVIPNLTPGKYTIYLSGSDIGNQTKYADVVVAETADVNFDGIPTVKGTDVINYLVDIKTDKMLKNVYTDKQLDNLYTDNVLPDVKEDNVLPAIYLPDKTPLDLKLGNETDPYDENAIRLN